MFPCWLLEDWAIACCTKTKTPTNHKPKTKKQQQQKNNPQPTPPFQKGVYMNKYECIVVAIFQPPFLKPMQVIILIIPYEP